MILLIDNYDSFVYNLGRYFVELGQEVVYRRNDQVTLDDVEAMQPDALVISPGPCTPDEAGLSLELVRHFAEKLPILGVCLGHQVIGQVFGGTVVRAQKPMHGKTSNISHSGADIFEGLPETIMVTRYHSLIVEDVGKKSSLLQVDARSAEGEVMAMHHKDWPTYGVQFHPEAVLTEHGHDMLRNFLKMMRQWGQDHPEKVA